MRVTGLSMGFIDVSPEDTLEYNRWWDLTMGPENAALPEMVMARRYIADDECQKLRGPVEEKGFEPGRARYCHWYAFGDEPQAAQDSMAALAKRLGDEGRAFGRGWARYQGPHRLVGAWTRPDQPMAAEAVPWLGHVAIHVNIGQILDPAFAEETERWYDEVHIPDVLETPGFLAALRLLPVEPERAGRFLNIFLLDGEPGPALAAFGERVPELKERGRLASPGKAVRLLFAGPYRPMTPLRYDFL